MMVSKAQSNKALPDAPNKLAQLSRTPPRSPAPRMKTPPVMRKNADAATLAASQRSKSADAKAKPGVVGDRQVANSDSNRRINSARNGTRGNNVRNGKMVANKKGVAPSATSNLRTRTNPPTLNSARNIEVQSPGPNQQSVGGKKVASLGTDILTSLSDMRQSLQNAKEVAHTMKAQNLPPARSLATDDVPTRSVGVGSDSLSSVLRAMSPEQGTKCELTDMDNSERELRRMDSLSECKKDVLKYKRLWAETRQERFDFLSQLQRAEKERDELALENEALRSELQKWKSSVTNKDITQCDAEEGEVSPVKLARTRVSTDEMDTAKPLSLPFSSTGISPSASARRLTISTSSGLSPTAMKFSADCVSPTAKPLAMPFSPSGLSPSAHAMPFSPSGLSPSALAMPFSPSGISTMSRVWPIGAGPGCSPAAKPLTIPFTSSMTPDSATRMLPISKGERPSKMTSPHVDAVSAPANGASPAANGASGPVSCANRVSRPVARANGDSAPIIVGC